LARFGSTTAKRYLVWRHYQEPDKPVIVLIGGTTGAGKTSVALEVARRLGIRRVLSTDSVRQVMRMMLSAELMPALHASSFDAYRSLPQPSGDEDPVIEGFLAQASVVAVGVRAIIERAVEENNSLVIDGVALVPGIIDPAQYQSEAHVIHIVMATLDPDVFRSRFEVRGSRQKRRGTHRYIENLPVILRIQDYFVELADRLGAPIVDNQSIELSVQLIIRHVVETLRKQGEVDLSELA
jgi:2-phosphoglycerate kinase